MILSSNEDFNDFYDAFFSKEKNDMEESDDILIDKITLRRDELFTKENLFKFGLFSLLVFSPIFFNKYPAIAKTTA
jgi:hypothetical protein